MTDRPFLIERLDHLVLRTRNLNRLSGFYQLLGCTVERDLRDKMGMLQLRLGSSMIDLLEVNDKGDHGGAASTVDGRNLDHFAVRVDPFDEQAILDFCALHNIEAKSLPFPMFGADGFGPAIYIKDPDGNRLELKGPPNEDQTPPVFRETRS